MYRLWMTLLSKNKYNIGYLRGDDIYRLVDMYDIYVYIILNKPNNIHQYVYLS